MDLFINTLTGTVFELRVSPYETILSIKSKLAQLEGIPTSQQHLIWRSAELEDDYCLHDYSIKSGATLTLVLAMRDGPINMRRVSVEEPSIQEMTDYIDSNRDEIWDKIMNDDKHVTLLVFRDGDQLNFFRVYDRGDGTLTPCSETISPESIYDVCPDDENGINKAKNEDNSVTKDKMKMLRSLMEAKSSKKKPQPQPPSGNRLSSKLAKRRIHFSKSPRSVLSRHSVIPKTESKLHMYNGTPSPDKIDPVITSKAESNKLPPLRKSKNSAQVDVSGFLSRRSDGRKSSSSFQSNVAECNTEYPFRRDSSTSSHVNGYRKLPNLVEDDVIDSTSQPARTHTSSRVRHGVLKPIGRMEHSNALDPKSPSFYSNSKYNESFLKDKNLDEVLKESQLPDILRDPVKYENYKNLLNRVRPRTSDFDPTKTHTASKQATSIRSSSRNRKRTPESRVSSKILTGNTHLHGNLTRLPSVHKEKRYPPLLNGKKKARCSLCAKKLGLATTYKCRCGSKFCATHRYPETHTCSYDYKTEGRKLLEKNNPVVTAPKLPKI